jgi:YGGT family.
VEIVRLAAQIVSVLLSVYVLVLIARVVFEFIPMFNREWRPRGALLVFAEIVYTLTDPPLRFFRRFIRPVRIGPAALDLSLTFTMIAVIILSSIMSAIARS